MKKNYLSPLALFISATLFSTAVNAEQSSAQVVDALRTYPKRNCQIIHNDNF